MSTDHVKHTADALRFTMLNIGARPLSDADEPFCPLLDQFPGSRIIGFEVDDTLCEQLNDTMRPGMSFHPVALGRTQQRRPFYQTVHPMCASLYKPNEQFISHYQNLEAAALKSVDEIETVSLDHFVTTQDVGPVDFIKIDIQGAELDVFQGGTETLKSVVAVVCEVEFVPIYENQPLFGDVCAFLHEQGLMFHKFISMSGRALKPTLMKNDPNFAAHHLWADAMFVRGLPQPQCLANDQLLKLGILSSIYASADITVSCLKEFDARCGTTMTQDYLSSGQQAA